MNPTSADLGVSDSAADVAAGRRLAEHLAVDVATLDRLRARLAAEADAGGLVDVAYRRVDSPFGTLLVAATPAGLVRVAFEGEDADVTLARLAADVSPRLLHAPHRLDDVARQLDQYFGGERRSFDVPVDLQLAHGFRRVVLERLRQVAYGTTASYTALAAAAGNPRAVRAAGSACAHNPVPIVVPCHRVVRSDGSLGNYGGGVAMKAALLALEAGR